MVTTTRYNSLVPQARRSAGAPDAQADQARVLAFVNTKTGRGTPVEKDALVSFQALTDWARTEGVVTGAAAERLMAESRRRPAETARALDRACELREALHEAFAASAGGRPPSPRSLSTLGGHLAAAYAAARLVPHDGRLEWAQGPVSSLDAIGHELARAAGRLVTSDALARVRACAAQDCRWWFVDDTRNRSRRWCDMKICGNREKLRRFRAKATS